MRGELVALDLETTGLDPSTNEIIEIGAVRIRDGDIIDEFSTLINSVTAVPAYITHITGIQTDDLIGKPRIESVLPLITEFIGSSPVIAHNISFDMGFLRDRHRILLSNASIDTYDLAAIVLPSALRYNLNSLTQELGIELEQAHRALDDARATALLYWKLWQRILTLPQHTLAEIVRANSRVRWETGMVFDAALKEGTTASFTETGYYEVTPSVSDNVPTLRPSQSDPVRRLQLGELETLLGPGGNLANHKDLYEFRPQQLEIAINIAQAFNNAEHLMIEAATGVGKTVGYLAPAILWATKYNQRVVISTQTINLQEQLLKHDIPLMRNALGIEFDAVELKGRSHYLSPERLEIMKRRGPATLAEMRTYAKILVWQLTNHSGDRGEINLRGREENDVWDQLSAEYETGEMISPYQLARQRAESAEIVVVNHSLLVSNSTTDNSIIPDYQNLIIDEAHHLEDAITQGSQVEISYPAIQRLMAQLGTSKQGLLGEIQQRVEQHTTGKIRKRFEKFITHVEAAIPIMDIHLKRLFAVLGKFLSENNFGREGDFSMLTRITTPLRDSTRFMEVQHSWLLLSQFFDAIRQALEQFHLAVNRLEPTEAHALSEQTAHTRQISYQLETIRHQLETFIIQSDDDLICWIRALNSEDYPTVFIAPLHVGKIIDKALWSKKQSVILLSATLKSGDNFDLIKERLHAEHMQSLEVGSPFNYHDTTLIFLPSDIPEPTQRDGYQQALERAIIELAAALDGRVMALFTSYSQLRQTAQAISPRLALGNITVFDQSDGTSRDNLLEGFRSTEKAVLLGTRSFWEGVDIPGENLSCLVITRLPFMVPTDPIFAARSDTYSNPFAQYALPEAILRFRQGFGRLIRRNTDRGIVVILDKRITSKGYGSQFLDALPGCRIQRGLLHDAGRVAKEWLSGKHNNK